MAGDNAGRQGSGWGQQAGMWRGEHRRCSEDKNQVPEMNQKELSGTAKFLQAGMWGGRPDGRQ